MIQRFIDAQKRDYSLALKEIKRGKKTSHWIWYIFPQLEGLGYSQMSQYYGIRGLEEAKEYINNDYLRHNLIEISNELLKHDKPIEEIVGDIDAKKIYSCMTLFKQVSNEKVFDEVIDKFYKGK